MSSVNSYEVKRAQVQLTSKPPAAIDLSQSPLAIISQLAQKIDGIRHPQAWACVVWLVGQYVGSEEGTPSHLEGVGSNHIVAHSLLNSFLASKVKLQYIFLLARYDTNYDVHDRARMLSTLLSGIHASIPVTNGIDTPAEREGVILQHEQVRMVLFKGKAGITDVKPFMTDPCIMIRLSSAVTRKPTLGKPILPDWLEKGVESSLRDTEEDIALMPVIPSGPVPGLTPPQLPNWAIGASAAAGVVLMPVLAPATLGIVGFSVVGPITGTLAAAIQSSIGNIVAGSAFAVAQSIAMGGAIPATVYAASRAIAGVAVWAASWFSGEHDETQIMLAPSDSKSYNVYYR
ncbi:hypothetical protein EDD18DRAFT_1354456 [Armillaria luteobubalina]|uniref:Uncharacterized protein n=1 Tax=Armillaria luteobubalina TaxID=153913 RepID=A0AA39Q2W1_9AGAR|nr:hypothetical protein EDD18DRAFT_1354456 [Armillaria luteobubalina]